MEQTPVLDDYQITRLARSAAKAAQLYFSDPKHMDEFKQWYKKKYGVEYKPRKVK